MMDRRSLLRAFASAALTMPFAGLLGTAARANSPAGTARRVIFFYFPDGIPEPDGVPSRWHMSGSGTNFTLTDNMQPLAPFKDACVFFNGLSMGATDVGSHPGGAKKLLTGVDGGNGESLDRYLSRTVGKNAPFPHLYLGAMATQNNASGDKFISYPSAGTTAPPEDNPIQAFSRVFGAAGATPGMGGMGMKPDPDDVSVIDAVLADMNDLRAKMGDLEKQKLDLHLEALRDVERRIKNLGGGVAAADCTKPALDSSGFNPSALFEPASFPAILRAQMDVMVQAMACGMTQVGVVQASQHTSELIMSRFANTPLSTPNYDMRSHQASHYGVASDPKFASYTLQRTWFVGAFAYLLDRLRQRPEGSGTMLDNSLVLMCSEISDGNTHKHDNMPFVLGGKGGGAIRSGRVLDFGYRRHSDLLLSIAQAMGDGATSFGQASSGALPGLLA